MCNRAYLSVFIRTDEYDKEYNKEVINSNYKANKQELDYTVFLDFLIYEGEEYICNSSTKGQYPRARLEMKDHVPKEWAKLFKKEDEQALERIMLNDTYYYVRNQDYVTTIKKVLSSKENISSHLKEWLNMFPENSLLTLNYNELFLNESFKEDSFVKYIHSNQEDDKKVS